MKKIMTLAIIAIAAVVMVACSGQTKKGACGEACCQGGKVECVDCTKKAECPKTPCSPEKCAVCPKSETCSKAAKQVECPQAAECPQSAQPTCCAGCPQAEPAK